MSIEPGLPDHTRHLGADDTSALRALAHPARLAILGTLRVGGPATVGSLAAAHGIAAGSASYHLKTLARHGFVEEAPVASDDGTSDRRTRWWGGGGGG
ncbi:helix-turn-helix domain-containing protein, partial [Sanguibacter sp. 25GB23B1]|uniref:winged helix-turn-helix domain-containing protein n=1 Tax=Sanguibacter sp. 25GB23B1 TaxID=3156067 RepID=UPI0032AEAD3C